MLAPFLETGHKFRQHKTVAESGFGFAPRLLFVYRFADFFQSSPLGFNLQTQLEVFSGGGKTTKNMAKQPGTTPFAHNSTGLKTDPGAFRFCQIERIFASFHRCHDSARNPRKKVAESPPPASPTTNLPRRPEIGVEK